MNWKYYTARIRIVDADNVSLEIYDTENNRISEPPGAFGLSADDRFKIRELQRYSCQVIYVPFPPSTVFSPLHIPHCFFQKRLTNAGNNINILRKEKKNVICKRGVTNEDKRFCQVFEV